MAQASPLDTLLWVSALVFGKKPPKNKVPKFLLASSVAFDPCL